MSKRAIAYAFGMGALIILIIFLAGYVIDWKRVLGIDWMGFQAYSDPGGFHSSKTFWDWMQLLMVPVVIAFGVSVFNTLQQNHQARIEQKRAKTESDQALDRMREDRLQAYLDRIQNLLEKSLEPSLESPESERLRNVVRTRTLTVLRSLDSERNALLFDFLHDSDLLTGPSPVISLHGANLASVNLRGVNLHKVDLGEAILNGADLSYANLSEANLNGAYLNNTKLIGAYLADAHLSWAHVSDSIYDNSTRWPDGFNPVGAGANKVDQNPSEENGRDNSGQA